MGDRAGYFPWSVRPETLEIRPLRCLDAAGPLSFPCQTSIQSIPDRQNHGNVPERVSRRAAAKYRSGGGNSKPASDTGASSASSWTWPYGLGPWAAASETCVRTCSGGKGPTAPAQAEQTPVPSISNAKTPRRPRAAPRSRPNATRTYFLLPQRECLRRPGHRRPTGPGRRGRRVRLRPASLAARYRPAGAGVRHLAAERRSLLPDGEIRPVLPEGRRVVHR